MEFLYTATSKTGKQIEGTIEANTREEALKALHHQDLHPLAIKPAGHSEKSHFKFSKHVTSKDLVIFTRQLSTMITAGVALNRSLSTLQAQASNPYFKEVIGSISKDIQSGNTLGDSFAKFPDVFSDVYINMVKAGEAGGILEEILKRLANQLEKESSIKKKIKSAMTYPAVILTITVIGFFGIMIFIIPKIGTILKDLGGPDAQLPIYTRAMLSTSTFMQQNAPIIIFLLVLTLYLLKRYIQTTSGKFLFHTLLLKIPVVRTIVTKVAVARFARTFASLMTAGVGVLDALEVTGRAIGNKVIEKELIEAATKVKNGKQLSETLMHSQHFPPIVAQMLAVGEETGKVDEILVKVADFYEEEVTAVVDGLSSLIEPLMIIILGGLVGLIAASVMGPIAGLSKNIQSN